MRNTTPIEENAITRRRFSALVVALSFTASTSQALSQIQELQKMTTANFVSQTLSTRQQVIIPIAAFGAAGNIEKLGAALERGFDAGLALAEAKEILVQLYAYAGFPRSLNALAELMKVQDARKRRGIQDAPGNAPSRGIPKGDALLAAGTANQTKLVGAPVTGQIFEFAPAIDEYLKTHLFGDIFERDNLDWQSRELATLGMLAALPGTDSQLQGHMGISLNAGLTAEQLGGVAQVLADHVDAEMSNRARAALSRQISNASGK